MNLNRNEFDSSLKKCGKTVLFKKISSDAITPVLALRKIAQKFPHHHFLFESAENGNNKGRFSVLGFMPDLLWKSVGKQSFINENFTKNPRKFSPQKGNVLNNLRQLIQRSQIECFNILDLPAMGSGIFGYMGYDMVRLMEKIPDRSLPDEIKIPDSIFIRPQIIIIFDNFFDHAFLCAPVFSAQKYDDVVAKISLAEKILNEPLKPHKIKTDPHFNFSSNCLEKEYCEMVKRAKKYIINGDIFQVLPSQRFTSAFNKNLPEFSFYRALRSVNPSPFLFYLKFDDFVLSGASPEIMVSLKNRKITIRPLAGTRKRGKNPSEDKKIAKELLHDEKEIAEHLMLIDLGRHDVGRVAKPASVELTEKMVIEYYSHVMHISSNVEGILRDDLDALDALISGFPAGTVSGAPKIRAMEIIEELEKVRRSFYAGCVGYFASNGDMESCITLRSALIKDGKIHLQTGAGVVFDSDPKSEYQECLSKAKAMMHACELIRNFIF